MRDLLYDLSRPLRAIVKRWGPSRLKQAAWHAEYKRGRHVHGLRGLQRSRICDVIERYAGGGDVLDLGCGDGHVGLGLHPEKYHTYAGVDISEIGVREAVAKCQAVGEGRSEKNTFCAADISTYRPGHPVDIVLFKDSLYYVNRLEMLRVLSELQTFLKPSGVFIVEMDDVKRHGWIRDLIRQHFRVLEDSEDLQGDWMQLVFR